MFPGLVLGFAVGAFGQGNTCASAAPLVGLVSVPFDTTSLSTSGFSGGGGCAFGSTTLTKDGFWQWAAPAAGDYTIDTFGSAFDTQLSIHAGLGCAATCIGYNDQAGTSSQSSVLITGANAGDMFLIQAGGWQGAFGAGVLNIQTYVPPCVGPDDGFEDNDSCATATPITAGSYTGMYVSGTDSDYYAVTLPADMELVLTETFDSNDCDYRLWNANCTQQLQSALPTYVGYTNTSGAPLTVVIQAHQWATSFIPCSSYDFDIVVSPSPCLGPVDDAFEDNDTCSAAVVLTPGTYTNLFTSMVDPDYYSITVPPFHAFRWDLVQESFAAGFEFYDASCSTLLGTCTSTLVDFTYNTGASAETLIVHGYSEPSQTTICTIYDIDVSVVPNPCLPIHDDAMEDNDDCASAFPITDGTYPGLYVSKTDRDEFAFCVMPGDTVTVDVLHTYALGDIDAFLWYANDTHCGSSSSFYALDAGISNSDNEHLEWTNTTGAVVSIVCEIEVFFFGSIPCNHYDLVVLGSADCNGGSGVPFCSPMNPNSTGASTLLANSAVTGVGSGLHLEATHGPPNQFGYFLVGTGTNDPGTVISQGRLCLSFTAGNVFGRYNVPGTAFNSVGQFNFLGVLMNSVGTSTVSSGFDVPAVVPIPGSPSIGAGSTWHFQLWHREAGGASNFSNGLSVTF